MGKRSEERRQELRKRYVEHEERQRQQILQTINSIPRGAIAGQDYDTSTLSDSITTWQIENGLREPEEREGLSVGQKLKVYNAVIEAQEFGGWPEGTVFDANGQPWMEGAIRGTLIPAKPNIRDLSDFAEDERQTKAWGKASGGLWATYRTLYPNDPANTVSAAIHGLRGDMSLQDLNSIADDPLARAAAYQRIHEAVWQIERHGSTGGYSYDDDDDTAQVLGSHSGGAPGRTGTQQPEQEEHNAVGNWLNDWQRKHGLKD